MKNCFEELLAKFREDCSKCEDEGCKKLQEAVINYKWNEYVNKFYRRD